MHNRFTKRGVTTLLLLTLLIVSVAIILPIVASADGTPANGGEIEDFSYQTLTGADVKNDVKTDLRFLFSINNLDYTAVGFVFSTSDDPVKTGTKQSGNFTESTTVYRSVTANGEDINAPAGRFWVAVQLSDIPHASFATYVYIRPYVEDGSGTRYGETRRINVCEALGHVHEIKNPTGTATLLTAGTRCGDCAACGLTGITELDVRAAIADTSDSLKEQKFLTGSGNSDAKQFDECGLLSSALESGQKFYPAGEQTHGKGRDFYYQIDMLWNPTMVNCYDDEIKLVFYQCSAPYADKYATFFYFVPKNDKSGEWNKYMGGFDWSAGIDTLEGPSGGNGKMFDRYPNLNDSVSSNDWGWHRIAFRVHQDAQTDGNTVTYSGAFYLYIDGEERWKVDLDTASLKSKNLLLYTMDTSGNYTANNNEVYVDFWAKEIAKSGTRCIMATANMVLDAIEPDDFETGVVPVKNPVASKYVLKDDTVVDAKVWFMAEHEHVWDGNEVLTREATVLQAGKKAEHCKLCGAEKPTGISVAFVPTVFTSDVGVADPAGYGLSKSLSSIRGSEHFYPYNTRDARNLYFEYSILWNETLRNWDDATEKSEMKIITFYKSGKHKEFYYLYSNAGMSQYCPYANHFDFSTGDETTYNNLGVVLGVYDNGFGGLAGNDKPITESSSPSIGAYGWHRIGVLVHLEASKGSGTAVNYVGWSALYVDGVKVWKIKSDIKTNSSYMVANGLSLFTATNDGSKLTYSDTTPDVRCRFDRFGSSTDPAYAIFGEAYWRIVDTDFDPSTEIEPVVSPAAVDYVIPGTDVHVNGAVYFKAAD